MHATNKLPSWAIKLTSLVKQYKPSEDAGFRNAFKEAVSAAAASGLDDETVAAMPTIRSQFERWSEKAADNNAIEEWFDIYVRMRGHLPAALLQALLPRKRKKGSSAPIVRVAEEEDVELIRFLVKSKLVDPKSYAAAASEDPELIYRSRLLDVATESGLAIPKNTWVQVANGVPRPPERATPGELAATYYRKRSKPDVANLVLTLALQDSKIRESLLRAVIEDRSSAQSLAQFASSQWLKTDPKARSTKIELLLQWIEICSHKVAEGRQVITASHVAAILNLGLLLAASSGGKENAPNRFIGQLVTNAFAIADRDPSESRAFLVSASAEEIHSGMHAFLSGVPDQTEAASARDVYQQHVGRKGLALELIDALNGAVEADLRHAVNAALFNAGLRSIGVVGELTPFDPHLHTMLDGAAARYDLVTVVEEGRALGNESEPIVLKKALVNAIEGPNA